jgi:hypothetical protein
MVGMSLRTSFTTKSTTDQEVYKSRFRIKIKYTQPISRADSNENPELEVELLMSSLFLLCDQGVQGIEPLNQKN